MEFMKLCEEMPAVCLGTCSVTLSQKAAVEATGPALLRPSLIMYDQENRHFSQKTKAES